MAAHIYDAHNVILIALAGVILSSWGGSRHLRISCSCREGNLLCVWQGAVNQVNARNDFIGHPCVSLAVFYYGRFIGGRLPQRRRDFGGVLSYVILGDSPTTCEPSKILQTTVLCYEHLQGTYFISKGFLKTRNAEYLIAQKRFTTQRKIFSENWSTWVVSDAFPSCNG